MTSRASLLSLGIIAALARPAAAQLERHWTNPLGGTFGDAANWDFGGGDVPGASDTAVFDVDATYVVDILGSRANDRLRLLAGDVTLQLAPAVQYELRSSHPTTPGLALGGPDLPYPTLRVADGTLTAAYAELGGTALTRGRLTMLAGSALELSGQGRVGVFGDAQLQMESGATATIGDLLIGVFEGGDGLVQVSLGSVLDVEGPVIVGRAGEGEFRAAGGSTMRTGGTIIGQLGAGDGLVSVVGSNTTWTVDGPIDVGFGATGELIVETGATVTCRSFLSIGTIPGAIGDPPDEAGGRGEVIVRGNDATLTVDGGFFDGDVHAGLLNVGVLRVGGGGRIHAHGDVVASYNSELPSHEPIQIALLDADDYAEPAIVARGDFIEDPDAFIDIRVTTDFGYVPAIGDAFRLIEARSGLDKPGLILPAVAPGGTWGVTRTPRTLDIAVYPDACSEPGPFDDCNGNFVADHCEIDAGVAPDCDGNGVPDACDIATGALPDCNGNGIPDACDIDMGAAEDCDGDGVPDACQTRVADQTLDGLFAEAVALDGDRAAIGGDEVVHVLRREGGVWVSEQSITAPVGAGGFGRSLDLDDDVLIVGAPQGGQGAVYVYRRTDGTWTPDGEIAPAFVNYDEYGGRVALDGDVVAVGAKWPDFESLYVKGYVFAWNGATWQQQADLTIEHGVENVLLPPHVAVSGDRVVFGVAGTDGSGRAFVHRHDDQLWPLEQAIVPPAQALFGSAAGIPLDLAGDVLVLGASGPPGVRALVYRHDGTTWSPDGVLEAPDPFGPAHSIAATPDVIAVRGTDVTRLYRHDGDAWRPAGDAATDVASTQWIQSIDVDAQRLLAGTTDGRTLSFGLRLGCAACPADVDADGAVGFTDLLEILYRWGPCPGCPADIDGDDAVGFEDLLIVLVSWGSC